jgi:hypothetical protein
MSFHEITLTVLTHPLQALLIGMTLVRLAREGFVMGARSRQSPTAPSDGGAVHAASSSGLRAA